MAPVVSSGAMGAADDDRPTGRAWPIIAVTCLALASASLDLTFGVREPRRHATSARTKPELIQIDPDEVERALAGAPWVPGACDTGVSQPGDFLGGHSGRTSGDRHLGPVVWHCTQVWDSFPSGYSGSSCEGPLTCQSFEGWATNQPTPSHHVLSSERLEYRATGDRSVAEYRCTDAAGRRPAATSERVAFRVVAPWDAPSPVPARVLPPARSLRGVVVRGQGAAIAHCPRVAAVLLLGAVAGALSTFGARPPARRRRWKEVAVVAAASLLMGASGRALLAVDEAKEGRGERPSMRRIDPLIRADDRAVVGGAPPRFRWMDAGVLPIVPAAWVKLPPRAPTPSGAYDGLE